MQQIDIIRRIYRDMRCGNFLVSTEQDHFDRRCRYRSKIMDRAEQLFIELLMGKEYYDICIDNEELCIWEMIAEIDGIEMKTSIIGKGHNRRKYYKIFISFDDDEARDM